MLPEQAETRHTIYCDQVKFGVLHYHGVYRAAMVCTSFGLVR